MNPFQLAVRETVSLGQKFQKLKTTHPTSWLTQTNVDQPNLVCNMIIQQAEFFKGFPTYSQEQWNQLEKIWLRCAMSLSIILSDDQHPKAKYKAKKILANIPPNFRNWTIWCLFTN
jgi:hypothetical protein